MRWSSNKFSKSILFFWLIFISHLCLGQTEALNKTIRATNIQHTLVNRPDFQGGNMIYGIPEAPKQLLGNYYLDHKWNRSTMMLYKDEKILYDQWIRYNIASHQFEVYSPEDDRITTIPGLRVKNLVWIDSLHRVPRYFINGMDLKENKTPVSGFYEVLVDGEMPLVKRTIASVKKSNYNTALMIGTKDDEIKKRDFFYYLVDNAVMEVPRKKKHLIRIFPQKSSEIEKFIGENEIDYKDPQGLYMVFSFYNSLFNNNTSLVE